MPGGVVLSIVTGALLASACAPAATGAGAARGLNDLAPEDRQRVLSNTEELQSLSQEERQWLRDHPEAARKLGDLSPQERRELRQRFESLPPAAQDGIRRNPERYFE